MSIQQTIAERVLCCWVYVIQDGEFCKVGNAKNVDSRLAGMATSNPRPLAAVARFRFKNKRTAEDAENRAHMLMRSHHVRGEWYLVEPARAARAIQDACMEMGYHHIVLDQCGNAIPLGDVAVSTGDYRTDERIAAMRVEAAANDNDVLTFTLAASA